jgi:hypothetical protein
MMTRGHPPFHGPGEARTRPDTWSCARTRSVTRQAGPAMAPAGRPFVFVVLLLLHRETAQRQVYAVASKRRARATAAGGVRTHASPMKGKSLKKAWQKKTQKKEWGWGASHKQYRFFLFVAPKTRFCKIWRQRRRWAKDKIRGHQGPNSKHNDSKQAAPRAQETRLSFFFPFSAASHLLFTIQTTSTFPNVDAKMSICPFL